MPDSPQYENAKSWRQKCNALGEHTTLLMLRAACSCCSSLVDVPVTTHTCSYRRRLSVDISKALGSMNVSLDHHAGPWHGPVPTLSGSR